MHIIFAANNILYEMMEWNSSAKYIWNLGANRLQAANTFLASKAIIIYLCIYSCIIIDSTWFTFQILWQGLKVNKHLFYIVPRSVVFKGRHESDESFSSHTNIWYKCYFYTIVHLYFLPNYHWLLCNVFKIKPYVDDTHIMVKPFIQSCRGITNITLYM